MGREIEERRREEIKEIYREGGGRGVREGEEENLNFLLWLPTNQRNKPSNAAIHYST